MSMPKNINVYMKMHEKIIKINISLMDMLLILSLNADILSNRQL